MRSGPVGPQHDAISLAPQDVLGTIAVVLIGRGGQQAQLIVGGRRAPHWRQGRGQTLGLGATLRRRGQM